MKQMRSLSMLAAVLCLGLSCPASAAVGNPPVVPALMQASAALVGDAYAKPAAIVAASPAAQALAAADNATASASALLRTGTLPGQALSATSPAATAHPNTDGLTFTRLTATPLTAEVGLAGRHIADSGKGSCKPPRKLMT